MIWAYFALLLCGAAAGGVLAGRMWRAARDDAVAAYWQERAAFWQRCHRTAEIQLQAMGHRIAAMEEWERIPVPRLARHTSRDGDSAAECAADLGSLAAPSGWWIRTVQAIEDAGRWLGTL